MTYHALVELVRLALTSPAVTGLGLPITEIARDIRYPSTLASRQMLKFYWYSVRESNPSLQIESLVT